MHIETCRFPPPYDRCSSGTTKSGIVCLRLYDVPAHRQDRVDPLHSFNPFILFKVTEFIEALMDDLDPRDAQEFVVARRIAEGELRLARADRFESAGLSAAGRLTAYDRKSGLGQEQEEDRDYLIQDLLEASQLLGGAEADANHNDWFQALAVIYTIKGVPPERREYPEAWVIGGEWWDAGIWKRFVLDKLVPRYWPSREAASAALEETAEGLSIKAQDLDGVAEERAVESALKVGGVLDRASILRSRIQRAVERDRAT